MQSRVWPRGEVVQIYWGLGDNPTFLASLTWVLLEPTVHELRGVVAVAKRQISLKFKCTVLGVIRWISKRIVRYHATFKLMVCLASHFEDVEEGERENVVSGPRGPSVTRCCKDW